MKNGAKTSNFENSKIYVGNFTEDGEKEEKLCAKISPNLP
jgi:hypothetical protein